MQAGNLVEDKASLTCTAKLVDKEFLCFPLNSKFPVCKILKVFLGDHSITK